MQVHPRAHPTQTLSATESHLPRETVRDVKMVHRCAVDSFEVDHDGYLASRAQA